jgi:hypothetical protein
LDTIQTKLSDKDLWAASIASINGTPFIAVGCGSKKRNFYVLEYGASNKLDVADGYSPPKDWLKVQQSVTKVHLFKMRLFLASTSRHHHIIFQLSVTSSLQLALMEQHNSTSFMLMNFAMGKDWNIFRKYVLANTVWRA